jgi:hypothetical protein
MPKTFYKNIEGKRPSDKQIQCRVFFRTFFSFLAPHYIPDTSKFQKQLGARSKSARALRTARKGQGALKKRKKGGGGGSDVPTYAPFFKGRRRKEIESNEYLVDSH